MSKQELIDKAVKKLKGKLPKTSQGVYASNLPLVLINRKDGSYHDGCIGYDHTEYTELCTQDEFTQRAKDLGWINGYQYGAEYETNGKKPVLDDDVMVQVRYRNEPDGAWRGGSVNLFIWENSIEKFRIVDDRFKPDQLDDISVVDIKNSWHQQNKLPPVGIICLALNGKDMQWKEVEILKYRINEAGISVAAVMNVHTFELFWAGDFKPIKSKHEEFVEAAMMAIASKHSNFTEQPVEFLKCLFEAGFHAPSDKE